MEINQRIRNLKGLRKTERAEHIKNIARAFYNFLNKGQYTQFSKGLFLSHIPSETNTRTKQRISKEVFKVLVEGGKVEPIRQAKAFYCLENKPLSSMDKGSYSGLMKANGYKMAYYKYEYDTSRKIPIKKKVGQSEINQDVNFNYDIAEPISHKPKAKQGVYTNSSLSVVKRTFLKSVTLYKVN